VTQILLVRHGQSTWNAEGRWQGRADPPLSALGEQQARQATRLIGAVDALVASPLERARRTAEIIGEELGVGPVEVDEDLVERAVGPWTGLTFPEIEQGWPGALEQRAWPEGFEEDDELVARSLRALRDLDARHCGGTVIAVTHGGLLHALERAIGEPMGRFSNLTGRWLTVQGDRLELGDRVVLAQHPTGGARSLLQPVAQPVTEQL
jgi:probable phosphoglycerate mutase